MPERPEYCTCGAKLVENARFCHLCGRPVFDFDIPEIAQPTPPAPTPPQPAAGARSGAMPVGFGNPVALRIAIIMSLATMLIEMIPGVNLLMIVWVLAAGWCGVVLYRRMTGYALSVGAGARLGSITGILTFLSLLVIVTVTVAVMGKQAFEEQFRRDPQVSQVLNDPTLMAATFLVALVILFAVVVGTCAAGGALGARYLSRHGANNRV